VRRDLWTGFRLAVAPTVALLAVLVLVPGRLPLAVRIYALIACAIALGLALSALRRAFPPARPLRPAPRKADPLGRPTVLTRFENEVILGVANEFDLHRRLAPRLRTLATALLESRRRVSVERSAEDARRLLGDETWELIRADRPVPNDRLARGIPLTELARAVDSLERI
jgi:hypothetical protein